MPVRVPRHTIIIMRPVAGKDKLERIVCPPNKSFNFTDDEIAQISAVQPGVLQKSDRFEPLQPLPAGPQAAFVDPDGKPTTITAAQGVADVASLGTQAAPDTDTDKLGDTGDL